jgi:hypothetical protein
MGLTVEDAQVHREEQQDPAHKGRIEPPIVGKGKESDLGHGAFFLERIRSTARESVAGQLPPFKRKRPA